MSVNWLDRLEALLFVALSGFMIWPNAVSSATLIALLLLRIVRLGKHAFPPIVQWWICLPALVVVVSWMGWGFPGDGWREVKLWPILPAALVVFYRNSLRYHFLTGFRWLSILQAGIVLVFLALHPPFQSRFFSFELREAISSFYDVHPTYLSTAWFFAAFLFLVHRDKNEWEWLRWGSAVLLFFAAGLAGGKMPVFGFIAICGMWLWGRCSGFRARMLSLIALVALAISTVALNPTLWQRFQELAELRADYSRGDMLSSSDLRLGIWSCSLQIIAEHPLTGVGSGNTRSALEDCFRQFEQVEFFEGEYNTHNQFLHFGLLAGVGGMLLLVGFFATLIVVGRGNALLLYTAVFCLLVFLTENYLARQLGMMFFSFFVMAAHDAPGTPGKRPASALRSGSR